MNRILMSLASALLQTDFKNPQQEARVNRSTVARLWWENLLGADLSPPLILEQLCQGSAIAGTDKAMACVENVVTASGVSPAQAEFLIRYLPHALGQWQRHLSLAGFLESPPREPVAWNDLVPYLLDRAPRFLPGSCLEGISTLRLERYLGGGGVGEVYLSRPARFQNYPPEVLKCVLPDSRRFLEHETLVLNDLIGRRCTAGIVRPLGIYLNAEFPALTFPWLGGYTLQEVLEFLHSQGTPPSVALVISSLTCLARILSAVHRGLYVHRDIKPANILVRRRGKAKGQIFLLDFGVAGPAGRFCPDEWDLRQYTRGVLDRMLVNSCSPLYASPPRRQGNYLCHPYDDIYSVGVLAIQALTGNFHQWVEQYPWQDIVRQNHPRVPTWFLRLLERCIHLDWRQRPANGDDLHTCLVNQTPRQR